MMASRTRIVRWMKSLTADNAEDAVVVAPGAGCRRFQPAKTCEVGLKPAHPRCRRRQPERALRPPLKVPYGRRGQRAVDTRVGPGEKPKVHVRSRAPRHRRR